MVSSLARVCQLIVALVTRDLNDPDIKAIVGALAGVVAAPSVTTVAALAVLIARRLAVDTNDPAIRELLDALKDLIDKKAALPPVV